MAKLLTAIARRCINEYEAMGLSNFYADEAMPVMGYCSDRMEGVLWEESWGRKPNTMGLCVGQATQDEDLVLAFTYMKLSKSFETNAVERLRHLFQVALAHEIKKLIKQDIAAGTFNARS